MNSICNEDCFHCPYPDCVRDDLTAATYAELALLEKTIINPPTWKLIKTNGENTTGEAGQRKKPLSRRQPQTRGNNIYRYHNTTQEVKMSNSFSLYQLSHAYQEAFENLEIDEATGEITNFADIDFIESSFEDKAINCALYIKGIDAEIEAYKTEEERLKNWRKSAEKKRDSFIKYIESCMDEVGKTKIQDPRARLSFRKSEQLIVDDPDMLPRKFIVVKTEEKPDKTAIKAAIKAGTAISGAHIESCRNLQIK